MVWGDLSCQDNHIEILFYTMLKVCVFTKEARGKVGRTATREGRKGSQGSQPYLSISDAIALYDVCRDTLYRLVRSKALRSYNLGKRMTRICREDLERNFNLRPIDEQKLRTRNEAKLYNLEPEYCYTIGEITAKFGVTEGTVYKHIRKFSIPIRQIGNYVYAPKSVIDQLYK